MKHEMSQELALENARTFISLQLIPALHDFASLESLDLEGRNAILEVAATLCNLPHLDPAANIRLEVDLYWDDRNWHGLLNIADSELTLRSNFCQMEGLRSELCGQWQHAAMEVESKVGKILHDPSHLWFWIDCFRRFVKGFSRPSTSQRASFSLVSHSSNLDLQYGVNWTEEDF